MKTSFMFHNGTSQLVLVPESARDEQYLALFAEKDSRLTIEIKGHAKLGIVITSEKGEAKNEKFFKYHFADIKLDVGPNNNPGESIDNNNDTGVSASGKD